MKFINILIAIMLLFPFFSFAGLLSICERFFKKPPIPSREWTVNDHNPQEQKSVIRDDLMIFIDAGHIFAKDMSSGDYLHVKGLSKVKAIVLYGDDLEVLANPETGNLEETYRRFTLTALTEDKTVYKLKNWDKFKWMKLQDGVNQISVIELDDGRTALSMASKLDPFTLEPVEFHY